MNPLQDIIDFLSHNAAFENLLCLQGGNQEHTLKFGVERDRWVGGIANHIADYIPAPPCSRRDSSRIFICRRDCSLTCRANWTCPEALYVLCFSTSCHTTPILQTRPITPRPRTWGVCLKFSLHLGDATPGG